MSTVPAKDKKMIWLTIAWIVFFGGPGALTFQHAKLHPGAPRSLDLQHRGVADRNFPDWWFGYKSAISNVADYED